MQHVWHKVHDKKRVGNWTQAPFFELFDMRHSHRISRQGRAAKQRENALLPYTQLSTERQSIQYRPFAKEPEIGLRMTSLFRARPKAHFLMSQFLVSVPEKTFSLVVHKRYPARMMASFIIPFIRVPSPASTAIKIFYAWSVLASEWFSDSGLHQINPLPELLCCTGLLVR